MAKISTYPIDSSVSLADYVIGTDAEDSNITKNYTIGSIFGLSSGHLNGYSTTRTTTVLAGSPVILANVYTQGSASKWAAATNRLTYSNSGTPATTNLFLITVVVSTEPVAGSPDINFILYKNGVALADTEQTISATDYKSTTIQTIQTATTADYFEVFLSSNTSFSVIVGNVNATVVAVR
jgi:hypothetical protein